MLFCTADFGLHCHTTSLTLFRDNRSELKTSRAALMMDLSSLTAAWIRSRLAMPTAHLSTRYTYTCHTHSDRSLHDLTYMRPAALPLTGHDVHCSPSVRPSGRSCNSLQGHRQFKFCSNVRHSNVTVIRAVFVSRQKYLYTRNIDVGFLPLGIRLSRVVRIVSN